MSVFTLKIIACISMVIDHAGAHLFPEAVWMRYVGRLAFPIYAFLISEGYRHTKDVKKYLLRLFIFALVSEIPYDLLGKDCLFNWGAQNVFFTLFSGLLMLFLMDWTNSLILKAFTFVSFMWIAEYCHFTYRYPGIYMIFAFDYFRDIPLLRDLNIIAANIRLFTAKIQAAGSLAIIPLSFYNGKRGPSWKYFFYAFYPCHLLIIYLVKKYAGG